MKLILILQILLILILVIVAKSTRISHRSYRKSYIVALDPLLSGSIAGAIGVGVAYPIDSIKTKTQTYSSQGIRLSAIDTIKKVINEEKDGFKSLYSGVSGVMIGQALIKATAFASNAWALDHLLNNTNIDSSFIQLVLAAAFSGLISSFVCNPVERIKVMMQAANTNDDGKGYTSEIECLNSILKSDGIKGFLFRGIDATLPREIIGYGFYFVVYSLITSSSNITNCLGIFTPLLGGALAGMAAWAPVYPFDVIKTYQQNTQGSKNDDSISNSNSSSSSSSTELNGIQACKELVDKYGISILWDGINPKLLRASVNHAVTFFTYDLLIDFMK